MRRHCPAVPPHLQEDHMEEQLRQLAKLAGGLRYHALRSEGSEPGFPDDLILLPRLGLLCAWELKLDGKEPTGAQERWLDAFRAVRRVDVRVVRPGDLQLCADILMGRA